jgi:hypothetical protein
MRVLAFGGAIDERSARAALDLARAQRADRVLAFPSAGLDGILLAARREARTAADAFLDDSARWLLDDGEGRAQAPPARVTSFSTARLALVTDAELQPAERRLAHASALVIELLGSFILLAVPDLKRARDSLESAHVAVFGGPEIVLEAGRGRALVCPGDIARGGALVIVDGPPDPRVSLWSLDGMVTEARTLALGSTKLTVQGAP